MAEVKTFGAIVPGWTTPQHPTGEVLDGDIVRLERMDPDSHAADLFRAYSGHDGLWDYLPYGPFSSATAYHNWAKESATGADPLFYVIRQKDSGHCSGVASYLRITPGSGSIEVGGVPRSSRSQLARSSSS